MLIDLVAATRHRRKSKKADNHPTATQYVRVSFAAFLIFYCSAF